MSRSLKKGFTLVELMTTIAVSAVVLTGVVASFYKITKSTDNAAKAVNLTNSARGLASVLASDFANAGRGFADLISLDVRFRFHEDFYEFPTGKAVDLNMYALSELEFNEDAQVSTLTLHWFDYDVRKNPSFFFQPSQDEVDADTWGNGQSTFVGGRLYSNNLEGLQGVEAGDILLIYNLRPMVDPGINGVTDWYGHGNYNQGLILQVGNTSNYAEDTDDEPTEYNGLGGYLEVTFADGPIFSNTLNSTFEAGWGNRDSINITDEIQTNKSSMRQKGYKMPGSMWMARKLGNADSFNRVTYEVVEGGDGNVLGRWDNGKGSIVATDVTKFIVTLGLDMSPTALTSMATMDPSLVDGHISRLDTDMWTRGWNVDSRWGAMSEDDYKIAIGRHTLQAEVEFMQLGAEDKAEARTDNADGGTDAYRKKRGFVQQYRLRNISPPITVN